MKKFAWKIEYSITLLVIFAVSLFLIPISFSSKVAEYISVWNEKYNKIEYMFTAMSAQADSEIVKDLKDMTDNDRRERLMLKLIKPYLRLDKIKKRHSNYVQHYMNGKTINKKDAYYFSNLYLSNNGLIVGIKDIQNINNNTPIFMMLIDVNGYKKPNIWGKDIYGINIFSDGKIKALGHDKQLDELRKDCSNIGTGVYCSYFYRIGGEFRE